jgi:hypothetical protein
MSCTVLILVSWAGLLIGYVAVMYWAGRDR